MITLQEIEDFFKDNDPGLDPVKLDQCTNITNPRAFVKETILALKAERPKQEKQILKPYYNRLEKLYLIKNGKI